MRGFRVLRFVLAGALAALGFSVVTAPPVSAAASVGTFDQCIRGVPVTSCSGWTGGNLTSGYTEDQVVPQRVELSVDSAGSYTFTTTYDDLVGSGHVIDYLATWNYTQSTANPCVPGYAAALCSGPASTFNMASDTSARGPVVAGYSNIVATHELAQADRKWTLYGGTITGVSAISHSGGTASASVTFTTTGPVTAILLFGAHLSLTGPASTPHAWPAGASTVSGNAQLAASIGGNKTHNIKVGSATPPPPPAAFTVTKSATPTNPAPGQSVSYTVTVTNTGGQPGSTTFTDNFDDRLSPSTATSSPAGNNCTPGAGQFSCTTGTIQPLQSQTFSYTATMPGTFSTGAGTGGCAAGSYPVLNTATVTGGNATTGSTPATVTVCVSAAAQFSVSKTVIGSDTVNPGDVVTYRVTVTNNGTASGSTSFTDDFDDRLSPSTATSNPAGNNCAPGASTFSCTTGTIAPNQSRTFTYTAAMPGTFDGGAGTGGCGPNAYPVKNSVSGAAGTASKTVCVGASPSFSVTKAVDDATVGAGDQVQYTVTVTNNGTASGSTGFTDDFDDRLSPSTATSTPAGNNCAPGAGSFSCTTGTILAGQSQKFVYTATMPSTFTGPSGGGGCDPGSYPVTNAVSGAAGSASKTVCVGAAADFVIDKSVDDDTPAPGQVVHYTVTVTNQGSAPGSADFTDDYADALNPTLPTGTPTGSCTAGTGWFDCTTGQVAAGGHVTFTYSATVPGSFGPVSGGGGCETGSYPLGNAAALDDGPSDSVTLCVPASPSYTISKSVDDDTAGPSQVVTYTVTVHNDGHAAGDTSFTDDFDDRLTPGPVTTTPGGGGCSVTGATNLVLTCATGVIPAGGEQTFEYSVTLPATYSGEDGVDPCATGTYRIANTATLDDSDADPATAVVCVRASAHFVVDKSVDDTSPEPGQQVTYTVQIINNGTAAGTASWTDVFDPRLAPSTATSTPAGDDCAPGATSFTCTTGTIPALGSQTFTYTATMPATFSGPGGGGDCQPGSYRVANTASTGTSSETVELCVAASPDFAVTKTVDDPTPEPGGTVVYTITVTNHGDASGSTSFTDDYDNRLDPGPVTSDPAGADCSDDGDEITCETGTIAAGEHQTFHYSAQVPETFAGESGQGTCDPGSYRIANEVTLEGSTTPASQDVCVEASPDLRVTKSVDHTHVQPGDPVTYTVTVTNHGDAAGSTSFTDDYDSRLDPGPVTSDPAGADCSDDGDVITCETGTIAAGEHQTFTYTAQVPATFTGQSGGGVCATDDFRIANDVSVTGSDEGASADVCVDANPHLVVAKIASTGTAAPGQVVTYTVTVSNDGSAPGSTTFTDDFDDRVTPGAVTISGTGGSCDPPASGELGCTTGTIDPGGSQTFSYDATMPSKLSGATGGHDCDADTYAVVNGVELADHETAGATVCIDADADFTLDKSVEPENALPGDTVTYTLVVTNTGTAEGSTTFTDDFDDRLTPSTAVSDPAGDDCEPADGVLHCTTGTIGAGEKQTFTYTAELPATYGTHDGTGGCPDGGFPVTNAASIDDGPGDSATVCVDAEPAFEIAKKVDDEDAVPGQTVIYTVTVRNTGTAAGSTAFTDDYDDRLAPSPATSDPAGADCQPGNGAFSCTTGTIPAGQAQTFTYTATLPASFTGLSGGGRCQSGTFPVTNTASLEGSTAEGAAVTVCVSAAPAVTLRKSSELTIAENGDQLLTYTLTWTNTGPAEAVNVSVSDVIPTGTTFVSCDGCQVAGSPATATWQVGTIAPLDGTDTATLVVRVTSSQVCAVSNTAQLRIGSGPAISSNTVTENVSPVANPAGAHANGSATGITLKANGLLSVITGLVNVILTNNSTGVVSQSASTQSGVGFAHDSDDLLSIKVPTKGTILSAGVLTTTSASSVTAAPPEARQTSTAEVANLCLVPIAGTCTVSADAVRAVASTMANGQYATGGSAGSTIANLKVVGLGTPVDLNQTTLITLNPGIFGKNSYVAINERTANVSGAGGKFSADASVTMIHLKITGALGVQAVEITVAQAKAHSDFPKTISCSGPRGAVSGHAYNALLYTGPLVADLLQGFVMISPLGGDSRQHVVALTLPANGSIAGAQVADSRSTGILSPTESRARSFAEIAGDGTKPVCVLRTGASCVVNATAIRSEANAVANEDHSTSTDAGSQLLGVSVLGIPIGVQPAPNTTIKLPGIGFVILNEQFCDNGTYTNTHSCVGAPHSGITVRSLRVVITVANNILGLDPGVELVVSEAHADASFS